MASPERRPVPAPTVALALAPLGAALAVVAVTGAPGPGLIGVLGGAAIAWRRTGRAGLGLDRPTTLWHALAAGVAGAVVVHLLLSQLVLPLAARVAGPPDLTAFAALRGNLALLAVLLVIAWTSAAFGEEILFRGLLQPWLADRFGPGLGARATAIAISASLFGASHFYQGAAGIAGTGAAGIVFGALAVRRGAAGALWAAVLAHGLYDSWGLIRLYLGAA